MALTVALLIGIAFGFTLERAGLGSAPKLAGQFYLRDFTVMKVMFTAIVVAMAGAFWLGRLGVIDLASVYVPETFLVPQLVGGAIFGAGFLIAGLCPGTSCVAAASGRGDGFAVMAGLFCGVLLTGITFAPLQHFYESTGFGTWMLPQLLHLPYGVIVGAMLLTGIIAFRRAAPVFLLAAAVSAFAGTPYMTRYVDPLQLAEWIKSRKPGLEVIDTRSPQEFERAHVPGSRNASMDPHGAIIVRADSSVYQLRGGIDGWVNELLKAKNPSPVTRYFAPLARHGC